MGTFLVAVTGLPTILFTVAFVVVVCFWLLVAVGAAAADTFDPDADLDALGMGGVPVAVAVSLLTAFAWVLGTGAAILLVAHGPAGMTGGLLRLSASGAALFLSWGLTCLVVPPLRRIFVRLPHGLRFEEPGTFVAAAEIGVGDGPGARRQGIGVVRRVSSPAPEGPPETRDRAA